MLTYYELDLGLNHVTRKWAEPCDPGSYKLLTVPGDGDWPGGVIVCAENWLIWKNQGCNEVRAPIPRRFGIPDDKARAALFKRGQNGRSVQSSHVRSVID